jgi:cystathionine beta-lyase/cystathionine gamma-synthase
MDLHLSDDTVCARAVGDAATANRPSVAPIYQTAAFDVDGPGQLEEIYARRLGGYIYTRDGNPNHDAFAADVARLEGAPAGVAAASGMGILSAALSAHVGTGNHVVAVGQLYGKSMALLAHLKSALGVAVSQVPVNDAAALRGVITSATRLVLAESISNPTMEVADLPALAEAAGPVPLMVDATFSPPTLLRPLEHGAAASWHSATKYLNGHGDVTLGVLAGPADFVQRTAAMVSLFGANANPFECWLAARGMRTLPLRTARVSATAMELAGFLSAHRAVGRVFYPGLPGHGTHEVARRLLTRGFGGMLAFELTGGAPAVETLFAALRDAIPFSPTLADARTTVSYPARTSHRGMTPEQRRAWGIADGLVRLSVGLEDPADLKRELGTALERVTTAG